MNIELANISNILKLSLVKVKFEAHYWGTFRLTNFSSDKEIPVIAEKKTGNQKLEICYNTKRAYYHFKDQIDFPIAYSSEEFFGKINDGNTHYFDNRKCLAELLQTSEYFITAIDDPEYFEEAKAYLEIIQAFIKLSNGRLAILNYSVVTDTHTLKTIELVTSKKSYRVDLKKVLFDDEIIKTLNKILVDENINDFIFSSTINKALKMVLLKLNNEKFQLLNRMGLLI